MKTLAFFGGARKNGNTMRMLNFLLDNIEGEKEIINCYSLKNSPCVDCRYCLTHNACKINDGMQDIYKKVEEADNIIFASPIYFFGVPGPMKTMLDRFQVYWAAQVRGDKPTKFTKNGAILMSGGGPNFENQFTAGVLELTAALNDLNANIVGKVLMDDADNTKNLDERPSIRKDIIKIATLLRQN